MNYESERKRRWLISKGRDYADQQNVVVKNYQETAIGKFALRAGATNNSAKARGVHGKVTGGNILQLWMEQNGFCFDNVVCAICGKHVNKWQIDHIIPLTRGGKHVIENLQLICIECHKKKTREDRDKFTKGNQQEALELFDFCEEIGA